jgi:hypothetical protein
MSNPSSSGQPPKRGKQGVAVLTDRGYKKLKLAFKLVFADENPSSTKISSELGGISRGTVSDVVMKKPVNLHNTLTELFHKLEQKIIPKYGANYQQSLKIEKIELREGDYEELISYKPKRGKGNPPDTTTETAEKQKQLRTKLFDLDYDRQVTLFQDWVINNGYRRGAFLIQGKKQHGQRWLINRLVEQNFPYAYETDNLIPVTLKSYPSPEFYLNEIWKQLGKKLKTHATPEQCVAQAFEYWKTGTLVIAFFNINALYIEEIPKLIEKFWNPLEEKVKEYCTAQKIEHYLLMFLTDSNAQASQWEIKWASWECQQNGNPQQPISLPPIDKFSETCHDVLYHWLRINRNLLGCPEPQPLDSLVQEIWDNSFEGIPESVFRAICDRGNCKWSDIEATLKL